ncbi:hypothetical protein GCM10010841_16310 [Deinococcus aerophilus]|uniref:Lipoprotein n=2 Tax=Deinococcus aerophilus TaxID=522488 RepID=A0ABQ2GSK0_9DEIO|nr:hypothetical protein GCM10010841_16310 [Deinococcus aerophilus]
MAALSLPLALAACGGVATPQASDQPTTERIVGQVSGWTGEGALSVAELPAATATIGTDGRFTLTLPPESALAGLTIGAADLGALARLGCDGRLDSSAAQARGFVTATLNTVAFPSGKRTQVRAATGSKPNALSRRVTVRVWLYSDRPTQLRGTLDCAKALGVQQIDRVPVVVALNTKTGWNVADLVINARSNVIGQLSADGSLTNATDVNAPTTWRTTQEVQSQIGF